MSRIAETRIGLLCVASAGLVALGLAPEAPASVERQPIDGYLTDGPVNAIARSSDT